jgi:ribosomal protein L7/L12
MGNELKPPYADSFGYSLAMRVMQSDLYRTLDGQERAECDELIRRGQSAPTLPQEPREAALTDARILEIAHRLNDQPYGIGSRLADALAFARAIERELRGAQEGKAGEDAGLAAAWKALHDQDIPASNRYVRAIVAHRVASGSTLKEAKNAVDDLKSGSIRPPSPTLNESADSRDHQ